MTERGRSGGEPLYPIPLPPELAAFLCEQGPYACLMQATDLGTAWVLKAPAAEIASARGTLPVRVQHSLYEHRNAPVIRSVLTIYDRPERPLRFEAFVNVADQNQREEFVALADQEQYLLLCYDEQLQHRLSKLVPNPREGVEARIVEQALELATRIPSWRYDYDRAKQAILRTTHL
jgi:hypothetical protein